jgi:3',5'-cyclic AMP phosphodiesterase CpdA
VTTILHVSDLHFGTEVPHAVEALVRLARAAPPDVLIVSGDITQRARRAQFDAAARFIGRLAAAQVLVIAGNHDIPLWNLPQRLLGPYRGYERAFGRELEPRLALADVRIAGVHTARAWRHVVGHVTPAQAASAGEWLAEGPADALRIVVTHHPLAVPDAQDDAQRLRGADAALRQWWQAGVQLALGGHIHRPYFMPLQGQRANARQRLWVAQAGTAVSHRLRAPWPHSVNRLQRVAPSRWRLQRWNLDPGGSDFSLHEEVALDTRNRLSYGAEDASPTDQHRARS